MPEKFQVSLPFIVAKIRREGKLLIPDFSQKYFFPYKSYSSQLNSTSIPNLLKCHFYLHMNLFFKRSIAIQDNVHQILREKKCLLPYILLLLGITPPFKGTQSVYKKSLQNFKM